jgi:CheY-like chemotaxis protein
MSTSEDDGDSGKHGQPGIVLVVEDDEACRDEIREILESAGHAVIEAGDGEQALRLLLSDQTLEPAVVVLDMWLPRMTGPEFLEHLRKHDTLARIPVVVTSASHVFSEYAAVSGVGWLPKPFDAEMLLSEVGKRCGRVVSIDVGSSLSQTLPRASTRFH